MSSDRGGEDEGVGAPEKSRPWTKPWGVVVVTSKNIAGDDTCSYLSPCVTEADANLISAAPELYEALEDACAAIEERLHGDDQGRCSCAACKPLEDALDAARAALKKARGGA